MVYSSESISPCMCSNNVGRIGGLTSEYTFRHHLPALAGFYFYFFPFLPLPIPLSNEKVAFDLAYCCKHSRVLIAVYAIAYMEALIIFLAFVCVGPR